MSAAVRVLLLRGINVGGRNKLPMADLVEILEAGGCSEVRTYIQSGNAVFRASARTWRDLAAAVEKGIESRHGFLPPVVLLDGGELDDIANANPFIERGVDPGELHIGFLAARPNPAAVAALPSDRSPGDEFAITGRAIHLRCPNGVARTKLTNAWFDRALGTVSTMRNWRTVETLRGMVEDA